MQLLFLEIVTYLKLIWRHSLIEMTFYDVPNVRLRKHWVKHVLKALSGIYSPYTFSTNQPKITLHCKSEQLHAQHHLRENFRPLVVLKLVQHLCPCRILHSSTQRVMPLRLSVIRPAFCIVAVHLHGTNFLQYFRRVLLWCDNVYSWRFNCTWATLLLNVRIRL